ncbi:hypothetical protein LOTGIDRAFT_163349 [Lottia gigantea]|uniref:WWE domain-containing protein n=1 Tax=Lottia gigantea TaxID=225164 RepID=V4BRT1_LOTGI|nr:hypothetical protein LOTGIDRAFT_163349 [Lottia gigantea]ESO91624.1 hypothetical protein LOTGIDRAFT_163349 [Lottia gigantea]
MAASSANFLASSANSTNCGVIVWEWFENNGSWQPYESDVVAFIEDNYLKGASAANLGKINPNLSLYNVFFSSTIYQIRLDTGNRRHVRRKIYQMTSPDLNKITWQWAGDYIGQWNSYSFDVASMIESVYAGQQTNFIDLSQTQFKLPYFIDLKNFQQVRIETGTARSIRREKLNVPFPLSNGNNVPPPQTFQQSALNPTSISSLLGQSSQTSSSTSFQQISQVTSASALSAHASQVASSSNSMPVHSPQVASSSNAMSAHQSQVQVSSSSLGKHRQNSDDSDGGNVGSGGKIAKIVQVPTSNHSYVQSYVNNLPSTSAASNTMPQITPYSNHMMYGNQMTGLITSSPYLSSLGLSSPNFNMTAGPSQQPSSGPLTRQQFQQMMQMSSFGGSLNMPMTPASTGFSFTNGITAPG